MSSLSKQELDVILQSPVSTERTASFLQDFLRDRKTTATIEMLFKRAGKFTEIAERPRPEEVPWTGFNALLFKAPFVDLPNWVPLRSWSFAVAMERSLLTKFDEALRQAAAGSLGQPVNRDAASVIGAFDRLSSQLSQQALQPDLYVLAGDLGTQLAVDLQRHIVGAWAEEVKHDLVTTFRIMGTYAGLPILDIPETPTPGVYAVDVRRFAELKRYGEDPEFKLEEVTAERAQKLLQSDPRLGASTETTANAGPDAVERLRLKVALTLYETYELSVLDESAAAGCPLTGPVSEWQPPYA